MWRHLAHPVPSDACLLHCNHMTDMCPYSTFPTIYISYPPTYTVNGQIPTTIDGKSTCATITEEEGVSFTWPSHPTIAPTAPILDAARYQQDPRGWSWVFKDRDAFASDVYSNASLPEEDRHPGEWWLRPFFPNLPLWDCSSGVDLDNPYAVAAKTALFLTGSSTSFEDGDDDDDHDEKTSSPASPASAVTARPSAPVSVAAASILISSSKNQTPGTQTAPSATPASTASDQLPLQPSQAPQTALGSPATNSKGAAASLQKGESIEKQSTPTVNTMDNSLPVLNSYHTGAVNSPSPNTIEPGLATPLVILPGGQSVVLSLSGSETTLAVQTSAAPRSFQFASQTIAVDSQGQFRVGSQNLSANQAVTAAKASTAVKLGEGAVSVPQNTNAGGSGEMIPASTIAPATLVVGSQTIQPNAKGNYIFHSQTLRTDTAGRLIFGGATLAPGSVVTVSGTLISLSPPQSTVGISGTSEQDGLGPAIMGGFGPGAPSNASVSRTGSGNPVAPVAFTGGAGTMEKGMLCELAMLGLAVLGLVGML